MIDVTHVAAFLSGVGAVLSAFASLLFTRKRMRRDCNERIEEVKKALHEGYEMGHR